MDGTQDMVQGTSRMHEAHEAALQGGSRGGQEGLPEVGAEASEVVQEVSEAGSALQMHDGHPDVCMVPAEAGQQSVEASQLPLTALVNEVSQLPVSALLNALIRRPESELREAQHRFVSLGAKVGVKMVSIRHLDGSSETRRAAKVKPEIRTACSNCRRTHFKCDSQKPCARCVSKGWGHLCSYVIDDDNLPLPKSNIPRMRKKPPIEKPGYSTSGDKLCEHGVEKRYCLHPTCVSLGGGKAMCKHGKRKRSCNDPACVLETQERRRQIQSGRCKHGIQMRCCSQEECKIGFQLAGHQYREKLKERKRSAAGEPGDMSEKPKAKRGRPPRTAASARGAGTEGDGTEIHDAAEGAEKMAGTGAPGIVISDQDVAASSGSMVQVHAVAVHEVDAGKEVGLESSSMPAHTHVSIGPLTPHATVRDSDHGADGGGEHSAPPLQPPVLDVSGADAIGELHQVASKHDEEHSAERERGEGGERFEEGKGGGDMAMGGCSAAEAASQHAHEEEDDAVHAPTPLEGEHEDGTESAHGNEVMDLPVEGAQDVHHAPDHGVHEQEGVTL
jgi:hypothetical protein